MRVETKLYFLLDFVITKNFLNCKEKCCHFSLSGAKLAHYAGAWVEMCHQEALLLMDCGKFCTACNLWNEIGYVFVNSSYSEVSAIQGSPGTMHAFVGDWHLKVFDCSVHVVWRVALLQFNGKFHSGFPANKSIKLCLRLKAFRSFFVFFFKWEVLGVH